MAYLCHGCTSSGVTVIIESVWTIIKIYTVPIMGYICKYLQKLSGNRVKMFRSALRLVMLRNHWTCTLSSSVKLYEDTVVLKLNASLTLHQI